MEGSYIYVISKESECSWIESFVELATTDFELVIGYLYTLYHQKDLDHQLVLSVWENNNKVLEYGTDQKDIICMDDETDTACTKEDYGTHGLEEIKNQILKQFEETEGG